MKPVCYHIAVVFVVVTAAAVAAVVPPIKYLSFNVDIRELQHFQPSPLVITHAFVVILEKIPYLC